MEIWKRLNWWYYRIVRYGAVCRATKYVPGVYRAIRPGVKREQVRGLLEAAAMPVLPPQRNPEVSVRQ